jgi:ATP-dependent 26S proteasome regulatory subunit
MASPMTKSSAKKAVQVGADADPKLLHLVRKFINASDDAPVVAEIVNNLRTQHREYQRKDLQRLSSQVDSAVQEITGTARKRKPETREEKWYDQVAKEHDASREQVGGGLNASLRNRYRQLSAENSVVSETPQEGNEAGTSTGKSSEAAIEETSKTEESAPKVKRRKVKMRSKGSTGLPGSSNGEGMADVAFLSPVPRPKERYTDLGGMKDVVQQIRQLVEYPLVRPELYRHLGVDPPRGVLLRGPPGMNA